MSNLFWSIYKNLENELISLTYSIHFDDKQLNTYSEKFIDLILRTSIEIEAISKQLYLDNGGTPIAKENDMYFDTICLDYLESKWILSKKVVIVTGFNFYFEKEENIKLTPLNKANKRGTSGSDWKRAYQAIKHNRSENYRFGNMKNCIRALAALFILNLYFMYQVKEIPCGSIKDKKQIDENFGSQIFTPSKSLVSFEQPSGKYDKKFFEKDIFVEIFNNDTYNLILKQSKNEVEKEKELLINSQEFIDFMSAHPDYVIAGKHIIQIVHDVGGTLLEKFRRIQRESLRTFMYSSQYCALNMNQDIYVKDTNI